MKFEKANIEIRINIFEILYAYVRVFQFSGKTNSFDFFSPNLSKNGFRVGSSKNYYQKKNQQYLVKMNNFEFFGPNLSKKGFRIGN